MDRHELDLVALVMGTLFTVLGLAYVIGGWTWSDVHVGWALAGLLVALGLAGIVTVSRRHRDPQTGLPSSSR